MHYYQFNIGDYMKHTARLSLMEDLAYRRMLDLYYLNDGPITSDVKRLARQVGMSGNEDEIVFVLSEFFQLDGEVYRNARADRDLESYKAKADRARANGRSGGRPPKQKDEDEKPSGLFVGSEGEPTENPEESESKANHKPLTNNQDKDSTSPDGDQKQQSKRAVFEMMAVRFMELIPEMPSVDLDANAKGRMTKAYNFYKSFKFDPVRWDAYLMAIRECEWMLYDRVDHTGKVWKKRNFDFIITEKCYLGVKEDRYGGANANQNA